MLTSQIQIYKGLLQNVCPKLDRPSAQAVEQILNEKNEVSVLSYTIVLLAFL